MKIYVDYNIFEPLQNSLDINFDISKPHNFEKEQYIALRKIWAIYKKKQIELITCEDDCLLEFMNYKKDSISNYDEVKEKISSNPQMSKKFNIFKQLHLKEALISPWGEYGYGRGPYGGGDEEHYLLLDNIRLMLNKINPKNDQAVRDAKHILHCILYGCEYFLTLDRKSILRNFENRFHLIEEFMKKNNYNLKVVNPVMLLKKLEIK